jgi:hypothetical protein
VFGCKLTRAPLTCDKKADPARQPMNEPHHPILEKPWQYRIAEFRYSNGADGSEPFIDLYLVRESTHRRLRFLRPRDLVIEEGCFPEPTGGMVILDSHARQLEGMNVRVTDCEGTRGGLSFWADSVHDLDLCGDD